MSLSDPHPRSSTPPPPPPAGDAGEELIPLSPASSLASPVQPFRPIRTDQYNDHSDDEDSDETLTGTPTRPARYPHRTRPSVSGLLDRGGPLEAGGHGHRAAGTSPPAHPSKETRLRQYDAPADGPIDANASFWTNVKNFVKLNEGFLLIVSAQIFFTIANTSIKLLQQQVTMPLWQLVFLRMITTYVGCIAMLIYNGDPHPFLGPPGVRLLLCLRGVFGFGGMFPYYYSLSTLGLSDSAVLGFLSPGIVAVLAHFILHEPFSRVQLWANIVSFGGVFLIVKPSFLFGDAPSAAPVSGGEMGDIGDVEDGTASDAAHLRFLAVLAGIAAACSGSGTQILLRYIGHRASALSSISYFALFSCMIALSIPIFTDSPPVWKATPAFFGLMTSLGLGALTAQVLATMGLQRGTVGKGSLAGYTSLIFALLGERVVFGTTPDVWSFLGAGIIISSALRVAFAKPVVVPEPAFPKDDLENGQAADGRVKAQAD